jgi:predicted DCC family thiol-disulfide oxidoreductase YuxK
MRDHLLLFDNQCIRSRRVVARILELDDKQRFLFSPLTGKTARQALKGRMSYMRKKSALILIENAHKPPCLIWMKGRAVMRAFWLLQRKYRWFAWSCYLPLLTDLLYRGFTALSTRCKIEDVPERFFRAYPQRFLP